MFNKSTDELKALDALHTTTEIKQQPDLWRETLAIYRENKERIDTFLDQIKEQHKQINIIFTGAGTSAFVGETIQPYLHGKYRNTGISVQSIPTTSIVSNPEDFLSEEVATILVSFARSGNSPESVATVELAKQIVKDLYQVTITCNADGELAKNAEDDAKNLSLLMPKQANDQGFAMTGAFTAMTLSALLIFDTAADKEAYAKEIVPLAEEIIARESEIAEVATADFNRIVYLGSGSLEGLSHEASLKLLELTAGKIATFFESSLGFRHGPKSIVDDKTAVIVFQSNNEYTRQYDQDILKEVYHDKITEHVYSVEQGDQSTFEGSSILVEDSDLTLPDAYLALPYIVVAQIIALHKAVSIDNGVDNPSPSGTVNRVVQGVIIHDYNRD